MTENHNENATLHQNVKSEKVLRNEHIPIDNKISDPLFKCELCELKLSNQEKMDRHISNVHMELVWQKSRIFKVSRDARLFGPSLARHCETCETQN